MSSNTNIQTIFRRLQRRLLHLRLQPIRVFCFHHVSGEFDPQSMKKIDWTQIDDFKTKILEIRQGGWDFISLSKAAQHIREDKLRFRKYAVITFDDGYSSLKEILPWLEQQRIPCTLFINGKYLDGKSYRENSDEKYLSYSELFLLKSSLIEIASHGWSHTDICDVSDAVFQDNEKKNQELLSAHPRYISFHAYTYGHFRKSTNKILKEMNLTPVLIDGMNNYNDTNCIHRQFLL